nr:ATP-binding protein [Azospirillum thermophilum]
MLSDGRVIEVEGAPMEGGGFVSTFTDVTERKQAEAELLAAKDRAEQALTDLRIAQENLIQAEKMASLAQLVAGVAHEVNTPIGVTLTAISHLGEEVGKIRALFDAGRVRRSDFQDFLDVAWESTRMIMTNIERAVALIQSFKQVAVDQASDERRAFDLAGYVNEVLLSLRPRLRKSRVRVTADIQPDLIVDSYPGAFSQVLSNLIMNALVHAFEEGQEGHIELTARETDPGWVELRYRDDGKGIADSIRPYIFDPFFTTKRGAGRVGWASASATTS